MSLWMTPIFAGFIYLTKIQRKGKKEGNKKSEDFTNKDAVGQHHQGNRHRRREERRFREGDGGGDGRVGGAGAGWLGG